jgi:hypothetical protein
MAAPSRKNLGERLNYAHITPEQAEIAHGVAAPSISNIADRSRYEGWNFLVDEVERAVIYPNTHKLATCVTAIT